MFFWYDTSKKHHIFWFELVDLKKNGFYFKWSDEEDDGFKLVFSDKSEGEFSEEEELDFIYDKDGEEQEEPPFYRSVDNNEAVKF